MSTQSKSLSEVFPNDPALELWSAYCDKMVEIDRLTEVNKELLEVLKLAQVIIGHPDDMASKLIAAVITKAEAVK